MSTYLISVVLYLLDRKVGSKQCGKKDVNSVKTLEFPYDF